MPDMSDLDKYDDRSPALRLPSPIRPHLRSQPFWESDESRRLRDVENNAAVEQYRTELHALVRQQQRAIRKVEAQQTMNDACELMDYGRSLAGNDIGKATAINKIYAKWLYDETGM